MSTGLFYIDTHHIAESSITHLSDCANNGEDGRNSGNHLNEVLNCHMYSNTSYRDIQHQQSEQSTCNGDLYQNGLENIASIPASYLGSMPDIPIGHVQRRVAHGGVLNLNNGINTDGKFLKANSNLKVLKYDGQKANNGFVTGNVSHIDRRFNHLSNNINPIPVTYMTRNIPNPLSPQRMSLTSPNSNQIKFHENFRKDQVLCPTSVQKFNLNDADLLVANKRKEKRSACTKRIKETSPVESTITENSFFRRGMNSFSSAVGVVANYINESFRSGIPFHVADRAMRESKDAHAKWWEGGVNGGTVDADRNISMEGNSYHASGAETNNLSVALRDDARGKRIKLSSGESFNVYNSITGSCLSASLEKNYNDMGIDAKTYTEQLQQSRFNTKYAPLPHTLPIDPAIIKPRKNSFGNDALSIRDEIATGYDIFNNVGSMYGNDMFGTAVSIAKVAKPLSIRGSSVTFLRDNSSSNSSKIALNQKSAVVASSFNLEGTLSAIKQIIDEKNNVEDEKEIYQMISSPREWVTKTLRSELIDALQAAQGDVKDKRFLSCLEVLSRFYKASGRDARVNPWSVPKASVGSAHGCSSVAVGGPIASDLIEGSWLNMSRSNYVECLGKNNDGDFLYTLGRMSFDMFQPAGLICSVQSTHNNIRIIGEQEELPASVPKSLRQEVALLCDSDGDMSSNRPLLRSYDIAVSITIEPPDSVGQAQPSDTPVPTKRMRAIMSVKGYVLPDPHTPNRLTVWFTGGNLSPAKLACHDTDNSDDDDHYVSNYASGGGRKYAYVDTDSYGGFEDWTAMFCKGKWRKSLGGRARVMAAKLLLGAEITNKMEDDGQMQYSLHRPVGGHGKVYVDVLYLDDDILIMRGHHGTIYAMARSCVSQRYRKLA